MAAIPAKGGTVKNEPFTMFGKSAMQFLRTELQTGTTLSRIALSASGEAKKQRNCAHARRAYDSILHFLPGASLSTDEASEVETKLAKLRAELKLLGEKF